MSSAREPIEVFNRYTGRVEREAVYGEGWLRWTYDTLPGRITRELFIKRIWFSRWYGWRMNRRWSARKIAPFIRRYALDTAEFAEPPGSFRTFNDFFSRRLKPEARPIDSARDAVVFPADGRHLGFADVSAAQTFYAKGQSLDLAALLGEAELAQRFAGGSLVISRLCPVDYHRFHFPCGGEVVPAKLINGALYSVSPVALRSSLNYLTENKRMMSLLQHTPCGLVAYVEIGATCVGTIVHSVREGVVGKGQEKGWFRFGGSCVITIFEPGAVRLANDLLAQTAEGRELYARMGDRMATIGS